MLLAAKNAKNRFHAHDDSPSFGILNEEIALRFDYDKDSLENHVKSMAERQPKQTKR